MRICMKDAKIMIKFVILRIYLTIFLLTVKNPISNPLKGDRSWKKRFSSQWKTADVPFGLCGMPFIQLLLSKNFILCFLTYSR